MERSVLLPLLLLSSSGSVLGEEQFSSWVPYVSPLRIPPVIDMRAGGHIDIEMKDFTHHFEGGFAGGTRMYGYSLLGGEAEAETEATHPSFPGPTILAQRNVPLSITWHNSLSAPHILAQHIDRDLLLRPSSCYPACGVPAITHIHGMEVPPSSDGVPYQSIYGNESRTDTYSNSQMGSTHVYHDHAMGLTRLNHWSGLLGGYVIEDPELEADIPTSVDLLLVISDTILSTTGRLLYPNSPCTPHSASEETKWAPESFGSVNLVNGVVLPYAEVPQQVARLRFVNGANSRNFGLNIPFFSDCSVIAKDMAIVNKPYVLTSADEVLLYPLERVDLLCDFSRHPLGTEFNITDWSYTTENTQDFPGIMQVRVTTPGEQDGASVTSDQIPETLNTIKNLQEVFLAQTKQTVRRLQLDEEVDEDDCPLKLVIKVEDETSSFEDHDAIQCVKGNVEKWIFRNPTADVHPFHWHAISVQCGPDEDNIDTNSLKDTVQIPNASEEEPDRVTQVCYVACVPNDFLVEGSQSSSSDFGFSTKDPYVVHCHMLEHEENAMMTYFFLADE